MTLLEFNPRWIHPNVFLFECPCGCKGTNRALLLSCKNIDMPSHDQFDLFANRLGEDWNMTVVPMKSDCAWTFSGTDFASLTITPSIDASASGHWHGCITNGNIK